MDFLCKVTAASLLSMPLFVPIARADYINPVTGHHYVITPNTGSWFDAEAYAESQGGTLAALNDATESNWIINNIPLPQVGSAGGFGPGVWLGGSDAAVEGQWTWVTGEPFNFTNWWPGEPNNDPAGGPNGEDYLVMWTSPTQLGFWNDAGGTNFGANPLLLYGLVEIAPEPSSLAILCLPISILLMRSRKC